MVLKKQGELSPNPDSAVNYPLIDQRQPACGSERKTRANRANAKATY